jgi:hypothetical protein
VRARLRKHALKECVPVPGLERHHVKDSLLRIPEREERGVRGFNVAYERLLPTLCGGQHAPLKLF